jgi:putative intracellular protease/amidase
MRANDKTNAAVNSRVQGDNIMSVKNILMLVGEFSEEYEIFVFQQTFEALGHSVDIVCPETKAG